MRILFITSTYPPQTGGGASRISDLAHALTHHGHQIQILTYQPLHTHLKPVATEDHILILRPISLLPHNPLDQIPTTLLLTLLLHPDAIILSVPAGEPSLGAFLATRITHTTCLWDIRDEWEDAILQHGHRIKRLQYRLYKHLFTRLYARADANITVTPGLIRSLAQRGVHALLLPNAAATSLFKPQPRTPEFLASHPYVRAEDLLLIYAGQVGWYYRLDIVIEALTRLPNPRVKLIIMGTGEKLDEYRRLAEARGLTGRVIFTGEASRREVAEVMNRCDLGVIPYDNDPLWTSAYGTKIFEHCAAGLPTLASITANSDMARLIERYRIGFTAPPLDVEAFAEKLHRLIEDRELRLEMKRNARELAENVYSRERTALTLLQILRKLRS